LLPTTIRFTKPISVRSNMMPQAILSGCVPRPAPDQPSG
jgi:hypothetical protein